MLWFLLKSILDKLAIETCPSFNLAYLYKVVEKSQRKDNDGKERCSQADDEECPQHTQQTQEPRAQ